VFDMFLTFLKFYIFLNFHFLYIIRHVRPFDNLNKIKLFELNPFMPRTVI